MNLSKEWDLEAEKPMTEKVRGPYLTKLFTNSLNKGIQLLKNKNTINILKTDLWNEGIDFERDILKHYTDKKKDLYGIDISYRVCKRANNHQRKIKVSTGSITNLSFKDKTFDLIFDPSTSDHLPPDKIPQIIKEYSRCLKFDGILVLIFDWWGFFWKNYLRYLQARYPENNNEFTKGDIKKRYIHQISFMKKEINKYFNIKEEYCIDYTGWTWNRFTRPIWEALPKSAYKLILKLEFSKISKFFKPFAKQYVIIAKKRNL